MGYILKDDENESDMQSELERSALFYAQSRYLLRELLESANPFDFLQLLLNKLRELTGGIPAICLLRKEGVWDRLVWSKTSKSSEWRSMTGPMTKLYEVAQDSGSLLYSDSYPEFNNTPENAIEFLDRADVDCILLLSVETQDDIIIEIQDVTLPTNMTRYITDIREFMIPLHLSVRQATLLDANIRAREETELLLDMLIHDLRSTIGTIGLSLDILTELTEPEGKSLEYIHAASEKVDSATRLIDRVKSILGATVDTELKSVSLALAFDESIGLIRQQFSDHELDIRFAETNSPELPYVSADDFLPEVFVNILSNCIKYSDQVWIRISWMVWESDSKYLRIRISDKGRGISDAEKDRLVGRFRVKSSKGFGLGMKVVTRLIDRYNGFVWIEDRVEGDYTQGSTVNIALRLTNET